MTVETLTIWAADLTVQALVHICRKRSQGHTPSSRGHPLRKPQGFPLPSLLQAALTGLLVPAFLTMETEIFPVHCDPAFTYNLMDVLCKLASLALELAPSVSRKMGIYREAVCPGPRGLQGWGSYLHMRCH